MCIRDRTYHGKALYDVLEQYVRKAFFSMEEEEKERGRNILWFLWSAPGSPLYGRSKMATFERYLIAEKETHQELKNAYYQLLEKKETAEKILKEFGLEGEEARIINCLLYTSSLCANDCCADHSRNCSGSNDQLCYYRR